MKTLLTLTSEKNSVLNNGLNWRGYLTKVTLLAIGFGSFILITKNTDIGEKGRGCFYALRKYFPRAKYDPNKKDRGSLSPSYVNEVCPVCLGSSKTGVRASCGHFLCSKCLSKYREVSRTKAPPCPMCRLPLKSITLASEMKVSNHSIVATDIPELIIDESGILKTRNVDRDESEDRGELSPYTPKPGVSYLFVSWWKKGGNYLRRNSIAWNFATVGLVAVLRNFTCEFIGRGSIFIFLISLTLIPMMIYAWLTCTKNWTISEENG